MATLQSLIQNPADFVEKDIFTLMGLQDLDPKKKGDLLDLMMDTVTNRVIAGIIDSLSEADQAEFEQTLNAKEDQPLIDFLESRQIDYNEMYAKEAVIYKVEMVNIVSGPEATKAFLES